MKSIHFNNIIVLFCVLVFQSLAYSQGEVSDETVDYINSKVTYGYIEFLHTNNMLDDEKESYIQNIKPTLETNTLGSPVKFEELNSLLKTNFKGTLNKLSIPINNLKDNDTVNSSNIASILKSSLENLKPENNQPAFKNFIDKITLEITNELDFKTVSNNSNKDEKIEDIYVTENNSNNLKEMNSLSWWWIIPLTITGLAIIAFIFFVLFQLNKNINEVKKDLDSLYEKLIQADNEINKLNQDLEKRRVTPQHNKKKKKVTEKKPTKPATDKEKNEPIKDDNVSKPIPLVVEATPAKKEQKYFYAGRPTSQGKFTNINTVIDEANTIFKLTYINKEKASFEVIIVSKHMERDITNSPDGYLYKVCNHKNSNHDFSTDIKTIEKGIAKLIGNDWQVDDKDKATIEFL